MDKIAGAFLITSLFSGFVVADSSVEYRYVFTPWQNVGEAYDCKYTSREDSQIKEVLYLTHETCKQAQTRNAFIPNLENNMKNQYTMEKQNRVAKIIRAIKK